MEDAQYERRTSQDLLIRVVKAETNIDNLKTNFDAMATEFRKDISELKTTVEAIRAQVIKVIIVVTVLSQAAGDIAPSLLKALVS